MRDPPRDPDIFPGDHTAETNLLALASLLLPSLLLAAPTQTATPDASVVLRIGAVDGTDALGRVDALAVDSAGSIYILESDAHRVRVYSASGVWQRDIGRRGSGPGELLEPVGMAWSPEGTLWVIDPGNDRATIFAHDGSAYNSRRLNAGFALAPWPGRFGRDGAFYHYAASARLGEFGFVMVRHDASMAPLDTIVLPVPPEPPQVFETRTERWGTVRAAVPFAPRLLWQLASDGAVWWAWTARYAVYRSGRTDPVIAREMPVVRVSAEARAAALNRLERFSRFGGRVDESRIPATRPALEGFFLDDADQVWTLLTTTGTDRVVEIHAAEGERLRRLTLPVPLRPSPRPVIRGDLLYGTVTDELDVTYVVVLRISPPPPSR